MAGGFGGTGGENNKQISDAYSGNKPIGRIWNDIMAVLWFVCAF